MSEFAAVTGVLETYFDGLYHADTERLAMAFHPKAIYATADETPLLHRTMDEYFQVVAKRESPASRAEPRRDVIEAIDFAGENTAFARVRCSIGARDFTDFLTFVRTDGAWRIMAKVFQMTERET
ncbi:nuclear transport factor 2 family protein [Sulfitobacter sp. M57]|uniref:nuclear transport factor 2 family protein n=1 Tax=unclassified Sulfitobacter TaxID=196795 RepID=UPI0023E23660|nr:MULTISPECIES: nuclear transport factor 2 family protein [unclassified Sulfitobacter]MDF3415839.1 nuclear transport factor 2 family protein [Sulfitobacter sp. KE5]MDF3423319.1 nuclear transport factor 2 family protein [Sulfitobacter sp. KE43]MDF3434385.1 nuclear transport factor 2 family protein [Sulfitobacter sp. KE42]MDF3460025.1 nuclear transport factor 2 family protein [Sulfitobacter sp. S74]MDF3463923.1 nuclear transport factor 2 family protein [Sulfitobacter sp. Ks18]